MVYKGLNKITMALRKLYAQLTFVILNFIVLHKIQRVKYFILEQLMNYVIIYPCTCTLLYNFCLLETSEKFNVAFVFYRQ
jgi:hypothetical protein